MPGISGQFVRNIPEVNEKRKKLTLGEFTSALAPENSSRTLQLKFWTPISGWPICWKHHAASCTLYSRISYPPSGFVVFFHCSLPNILQNLILTSSNSWFLFSNLQIIQMEKICWVVLLTFLLPTLPIPRRTDLLKHEENIQHSKIQKLALSVSSHCCPAFQIYPIPDRDSSFIWAVS